jgi:hypothetical protein
MADLWPHAAMRARAQHGQRRRAPAPGTAWAGSTTARATAGSPIRSSASSTTPAAGSGASSPAPVHRPERSDDAAAAANRAGRPVRLGSNPLQVLKDNIPGYRLLRDGRLLRQLTVDYPLTDPMMSDSFLQAPALPAVAGRGWFAPWRLAQHRAPSRPRRWPTTSSPWSTRSWSPTPRCRAAGRIREDAARSKRPLPPPAELRKQVLDALIDERVQVTNARDSGQKVDEAELDRAVANVAVQNQMTMEQLRDAAAAARHRLRTFRNNVRDQMLVERVREREVQSAHPHQRRPRSTSCSSSAAPRPAPATRIQHRADPGDGARRRERRVARARGPRRSGAGARSGGEDFDGSPARSPRTATVPGRRDRHAAGRTACPMCSSKSPAT